MIDVVCRVDFSGAKRVGVDDRFVRVIRRNPSGNALARHPRPGSRDGSWPDARG